MYKGTNYKVFFTKTVFCLFQFVCSLRDKIRITDEQLDRDGTVHNVPSVDKRRMG